jgi:hypothetical protein
MATGDSGFLLRHSTLRRFVYRWLSGRGSRSVTREDSHSALNMLTPTEYDNRRNTSSIAA